MTRKFAVDDVALLPDGRRQVVVAVEAARHGGHCRYGFRVSGARVETKVALGFATLRTKDRLWWPEGPAGDAPSGNIVLSNPTHGFPKLHGMVSQAWATGGAVAILCVCKRAEGCHRRVVSDTFQSLCDGIEGREA